MDDFERTRFAKIYIEKLSQGINPINDEILPKEDIVNNSHISNCLRFVSDLLAKVIEKEENRNVKKPKKSDFDMSDEELSAFRFSKSPLSVTEISRRINDLRDEEVMKRFSSRNISDWLLERGFLKIVENNGASHKRPTEAGNSIGIFTEERMSPRGPYTAVLYNEEAQHFIIDNFDSILIEGIDRKANKGKKEEITSKEPSPWTEAQDMALRQMIKSGTSVSQIAMLLKREEREIHERIKTVSESRELPNEPERPWFNFTDESYTPFKKMTLGNLNSDEEERPDIAVIDEDDMYY